MPIVVATGFALDVLASVLELSRTVASERLVLSNFAGFGSSGTDVRGLTLLVLRTRSLQLVVLGLAAPSSRPLAAVSSAPGPSGFRLLKSGVVLTSIAALLGRSGGLPPHLLGLSPPLGELLGFLQPLRVGSFVGGLLATRGSPTA